MIKGNENIDRVKSELGGIDNRIRELFKGVDNKIINLGELLINGDDAITHQKLTIRLWSLLYSALINNLEVVLTEAIYIIDNWNDTNKFIHCINPEVLNEPINKWSSLEFLYEQYIKVKFITGRYYNDEDVFNIEILKHLDKLSKGKRACDFLNVVGRVTHQQILEFARSEEFRDLKKGVKEQGENNESLKSSIDSIVVAQGQADTLRSQVDNLNIDLNNILLSKAYHDMLSDKRRERSSVLYTCQFLSLFCISVPFITIMFHDVILAGILQEGELQWHSLVLYLSPLLFIEFAFLYFFRLSYSELRGINAQIIQIQVRLSACKFIGDYVKQKQIAYNESLFGKRDAYDDIQKLYEKMNSKGESHHTLCDVGMVKFPDEFEKLIFSPIQTSGDNIPAALDGVNSIAELAGKVMSAKK
ncbi:hypothetical protein H2Y57_07105 [Pectobacterium aroidearum]|uniref:Uncharacterized protein n=1 Tax=Pectobacterium aroidearum TaxID=1201031 RepID=A0AAW3SQZ9_9GAMM|nr:hypothetical protein [Pectobacterium aroidearum]MBA5203456.1 hypothetical protein [Pectobacterium aroidearum]